MKTERPAAARPGKMVIFEGAKAPTLDETGMMSTPELAPDANFGPDTMESLGERSEAASRLTVPFRQEGAGGFSLVDIEFEPGYLLPRHSHSVDCLYYVVSGSIVMGQRTLGPGDGFFLPAGQPYAYHAGPAGVKLLEFRHAAEFDMQILEKDMDRFREKMETSLAEAGAAADSSVAEGAVADGPRA